MNEQRIGYVLVALIILAMIFKAFIGMKKDDEVKQKSEKPAAAMFLYANGDRYSFTYIIESLKDFWGLEISEISEEGNTALVKTGDNDITFSFIDKPLFEEEIEDLMKYDYSGRGLAVDDLKAVSGYVFVQVGPEKAPSLEKYRLLSKAAVSLFMTSNAIGVYKGEQTLLIKREEYLEYTEIIKAGSIPVPLWIYIGLMEKEEGNSIYTYGLSEFGKREVEIVDSTLSFDELYRFIADVCIYIIEGDITLKDGETIGRTPDDKSKIEISKGAFMNKETVKIKI